MESRRIRPKGHAGHGAQSPLPKLPRHPRETRPHWQAAQQPCRLVLRKRVSMPPESGVPPVPSWRHSTTLRPSPVHAAHRRPPRAPGTAGDPLTVFAKKPSAGRRRSQEERTARGGSHQEAATAAHPRSPPTHLRRWPRLPSLKRRTPAERRRPWTRRPSSLQIVNERKEEPAAFPLQVKVTNGHRSWGPASGSSFVSPSLQGESTERLTVSSMGFRL